jgi:hypothetical protein
LAQATRPSLSAYRYAGPFALAVSVGPVLEIVVSSFGVRSRARERVARSSGTALTSETASRSRDPCSASRLRAPHGASGSSARLGASCRARRRRLRAPGARRATANEAMSRRRFPPLIRCPPCLTAWIDPDRMKVCSSCHEGPRRGRGTEGRPVTHQLSSPGAHSTTSGGQAARATAACNASSAPRAQERRRPVRSPHQTGFAAQPPNASRPTTPPRAAGTEHRPPQIGRAHV